MGDERAEIFEIIDALLDELEASHFQERALFTERSYTNQPILQTGRQLQERYDQESQKARAELRFEQREQARRARHQHRSVRTAESISRPWGQDRSFDVQFSDWSQEWDAGVVRGMDVGPVPKRYYEMRALASKRDGSFRGMERLFFEQAVFMADFDDDWPYTVTYMQYYPTYAVMDIAQLRTYFTWRSKLRSGVVQPVSVSYAYLYVYELLCGIGTEAGRGAYQDLWNFWQLYSPYADGTYFDSFLHLWTRDYAIYHDIVDVLDIPVDHVASNAALHSFDMGNELSKRSETENLSSGRDTTSNTPSSSALMSHREGVVCLLDAEAAILSKVGRTRKVSGSSESAAMPTDDELFRALASVSRYHIERSRFAKAHYDDLVAITSSVFSALVIHCSRRRKTDFVEGLFGHPRKTRYTMFSSAIFWDPAPPPDGTVVSLGKGETFSREYGCWWRELAYSREQTSQELGHILRAIDAHARVRYSFRHPIKVPKRPAAYVMRIIATAVDERIAAQREAEAKRIRIDRSKLSNIRASAANTREALLVDEERDELPEREETNSATNTTVYEAVQQSISVDQKQGQGIPDERVSHMQVDADVSCSSAEGVLNAVERRFLHQLLQNDPPAAVCEAAADGSMLSMFVDTINEKLFDTIGDAVVEFDGEMPVLIEEYAQDVREVMGDE